jgi:hypothetical protein
VEDQIIKGALYFRTVLVFEFPSLVIFGVLPAAVKVINFRKTLAFNLEKIHKHGLDQWF